MSIRPQTSYSFIGTAQSQALPRADRESQRSPARPGDPLQPPPQTDPPPEDVYAGQRARTDPSQDLASLPSDDAQGEPRAIAVGYQQDPAELGGVGPRRDDLQAIAAAPRETRLSFYGLNDVLLKDSRGSKADIGKAKPRPPLGSSFAAERASQMYLPEADRRQSPLPEDGRAPRAGRSVPLSQIALLAPPAPGVLAPHSVPLPVRRSAMASLAPAANADARGNPIEGYRADVRAHLAGHRPKGGAGSGDVVVAFTLSRAGKLMSARILRSSGAPALDNSVLAAVRRSAPFPKAPVAATAAHLQFAIPFRFR